MLFRNKSIQKKIICLFIIAGCFLWLSCSSPIKKNDCSKFKTGTFFFRFKSENKLVRYSLSRNNTTQTEINEATGATSKYKIIWIDSCNYKLKFLRGSEVFSANELQLKKIMTITTAILQTTNDYYVFQSKSDKSDYVLQDTMWLKK